MQENPPEAPGFTASLAQAAALTDRTLTALMDRIEAQALTAGRKRLAAAMRHATLGGGKRIRPFLALTAARCLAPGNASIEAAALKAAIAVELIHCYSLVHDDMPAMDNDMMRRGMPTVHALHGDAVAILVGDALQTLAFETLGEIEDPALGLALVRILARASGEAGMVGGQMLDLHAEGRFESETRETPEPERKPLALSLDGIAEVQSLKTGAIIIAAAEMGALCGGAAVGSVPFEGLSRYAAHLGRAFQIADDIIDATGDAGTAGKAVAKDAAAGKATFVSALGLDGARERLAREIANGEAALAGIGDASDLVGLIRSMASRKA